jgi:hypothetical protein
MPRKKTNTDHRDVLLEDLSRFAGGGAAEIGQEDSSSLFRSHLPIAEHRRVLDRDTLLVLGGRGVGKTQLFRVLNALKKPGDLLDHDARGSNTPGAELTMHQGFTISGTDFPRPEVLEKALSGGLLGTPENLWLGLLVGTLLGHERAKSTIESHLGGPLTQLFSENLAFPSTWLPRVTTELEKLYGAVDLADRKLVEANCAFTITYDDLDLLVAKLADAYPLIRGLLAFWLRGVRRWKALRCKVFLRTDIFGAEEFAFPDSSKLRPLSVTLRWSADNLYRLVLKRLLNGGHRQEWERFIKITKTKLKEKEPWGVLPTTIESDHRGFMELLIGKYMGADKRRGDTYQWFLNHLQDSRGDIAPRSFLKLFEIAAKRQEMPPSSSEKLLTPEQVAVALSDVSKDRIKELEEEYRWIDALIQDVQGAIVPMERTDFRKRLKSIDAKLLPEHARRNKDTQIEYLIGLGILRQTGDGRIHVPDVYLFGFGLKRKGGIRRPQA